MRRKKLSDADREDIVLLNARNPRMWTRKALAHEFGVSEGTVHWVLNPEGYARLMERNRGRAREEAERRRERERGAADARRAAGSIVRVINSTQADRDWKKNKKLIPEDTRTFTQKFCGDPLPGRSALDRMRAAGGGA